MLLSALLLCITLTQGFIFNRQKCYGKYGCFDGKSPYNNARGFIPEAPESMGIEFLLYTRSNKNQPHTLKEDDPASVHSSHYNPKHNTKFIIHGYGDNGRASYIGKMAQEFFKAEDVNVIAVNWQKGADKTNYFQAAANTRVVGAVTAEMIKTLHGVGASYSNFHLIGYSLGAHTAGYAGEIIHGLGRITGLDPAGPAFENYSPPARLDKSDANFVDAIHTDGESLAKLGLGMLKESGDVDFYPNGGFDQPGCPVNTGDHLFSVITGGFDKLKQGAGCSHGRAVEFFTASINNHCQYKSFPCSESQYKAGHCTSCGHGCATMGYHASPSSHGSFYLKTSATGPNYCCEYG